MSVDKTVFRQNQILIQKTVEEAGRLLEQRDFLGAEEFARAALKKNRNNHAAQNVLGLALAEQAKPEKLLEAVEMCAAAVHAQPKNPNYINALANVTAQIGEFERAEKLYNKALEIAPGQPDARYNLAKLWTHTGRYQEALNVFQEMLSMTGDSVDIFQNIGACQYSLGEFKQALFWFKLALGYSPNDPELHKNYALCLFHFKSYDEALKHFNLSIQFNIEDYSLFMLIAYCHHYLGEYAPAEEFVNAYREHAGDEIGLDELNCLTLLVSIYKAWNQDDRAEECLAEINEKFPDQAWAYSNYLFSRIFRSGEAQQDLFNKHLQFAERYEAPFKSSWGGYKNSVDPERKLKVGYVSADFFSHSVSYFSLPLIANHDRSSFEIHCFSAQEVEKDPVSQRIRREVTWHNIQNKSTDEVVKLVREKQIDILVDLSGHTGGNQLLSFARKPAPLQFTWIGYPFTTGLSAIDYRIVDKYIEPEGSECLSSEKLLRIEGCFCAYRPSVSRPHRLTSGELDIKPTPALANGFVTFGCCNTFHKVTDFTLSLWARILKETPNSKLLLEVGNASAPDVLKAVHEKIERAGIDLLQVEITDRRKNMQYMLYHQIDIVLDPFPCNGGTTTCDALFMSVPVVSLQGDSFMSRLGASFISNAGHPEWVTHDPDQYVAIATQLASNIEALNHIRQNLRHEVETSPVMDEIGFARKVERAYRQFWRDWCAEHAEEQKTTATILPEQENQAAAPVLTGDDAKHQEALDKLHTLVKQQQWEEASQQLETISKTKAWTAQNYFDAAKVKAHDGMSLGMASSIANQKLDQASTFIKSTLELQPNNAMAWALQGELQVYRNRYEEAELSFMRALKFAPDCVSALLGLAVLVSYRLDFASAHKFWQHAANLDAKNPLVYIAAASVYAAQGLVNLATEQAKLAYELGGGAKSLNLLAAYSLSSDVVSLDEQAEVLANYQKEVKSLPFQMTYTNDLSKTRRLKLGVMAGSLNETPWSYVWLPFLEFLDRTKFELFIYYYGEQFDQTIHRLKQMTEPFRCIRGLDATIVEALLKDDEIDILISFAEYGTYSVLPFLSSHTVPVQIAWPQTHIPLPPGSTNYQLSSQSTRFVAEKYQKNGYLDETVKMLYVDSVAAYKPYAYNPEFHNMPIFQKQTKAPCAEAGYVMFGCEADLLHMPPSVLAAWGDLMMRVPNSKLKLRTLHPAAHIVSALEKQGVSPDRVVVSSDPRDTRYHFYLNVDIALDTHPNSSVIQTMDALWMGVPVLTWCSARPQSWGAATVLHQLGLADWIHDSAEGMTACAVALAENLTALNDWRGELRSQMESSSLLDCLGFTRSMEKALYEAWGDWCDSDAALTTRMFHQQREQLDEAALQMNNGEYSQAAAIYVSLLKSTPLLGEAMYGLGLSYLMRGEPQPAIDLLSRAVKALQAQNTLAYPVLAACLISLGHAHLATNHVELATSCFRESLAYQDSEQVQKLLKSLTDSGEISYSLH